MSVSLVIPPRERDLGDGMKVRRALPFVHKRMVGPFIFWDHMGPVKVSESFEMLVRSHPHIGLSTLTYLFSGEILHRDSLGNELKIKAGEVNWMTAGRGISHSERSAPEHGQNNMTVEGIQLWIALPKSHEEVAPSFVHYDAQELPTYKQGGVEWRVIAGEYQGVRSPVATYSPLFYFEASITQGHLGEFPMPTTHEAALYVAKGEVQVDGVTHGEGVLVVFAPGSTVQFKAGSDSRVLIFGGEPLPEPRHIWWNFVSSSKERIEQAKVEWRNQREEKFGKVPKEKDFIPLPEN